MGYPNNIKRNGTLGLRPDIFEWWKSAIVYEDEKEGFKDFNTVRGTYFPLFPFNRATFYNWLNSHWSIGIMASNIYNQATPLDGWKVLYVNNWGKYKSFELALFGSVGNGGDLNAMTLSIFDDNKKGIYGINAWTKSSLTYLRYALTRFNTYGSCINGDIDSGEAGSESELLKNYFKTELSTNTLLADCGNGFQYNTYGLFTITILNAEGVPQDNHPDYIFTIGNFGQMTVPNGSSQSFIDVNISDCGYYSGEPHIDESTSPIPKYIE